MHLGVGILNLNKRFRFRGRKKIFRKKFFLYIFNRAKLLRKFSENLWVSASIENIYKKSHFWKSSKLVPMGPKRMSGDVFRVVSMFLDFFGPPGAILDQKSRKNFFCQKNWFFTKTVHLDPKTRFWRKIAPQIVKTWFSAQKIFFQNFRFSSIF